MAPRGPSHCPERDAGLCGQRVRRIPTGARAGSQVVASVQAEIEYNRGALEPFLPFHGAWSTAIDQLDPGAGTGPGIDAFFAARPPIPPGIRQNVPFLRRAAWDTASSTGALRLIDYDLAAALSEIYGPQQYASSI